MLLSCMCDLQACWNSLCRPPSKETKDIARHRKLLRVSSVSLPGAASLLNLNVRISDSTDSSPQLYFPLSLKWKKVKDSFQTIGKDCLLRQKVLLTEERICQQAGAYICAFYKIWCKRQENNANSNENKSAIATDPISIKKLVNDSKLTSASSTLIRAFTATYIDLTNT